MIKFRIILTGHVACMWERKGPYTILVGNPGGKVKLEDLDVDGKIVLNLIFNKSFGMVWAAMIWLRIRTIVRLL
jgi:hypothetical protein